MSEGTVKWFNEKKGFGFIARMTVAIYLFISTTIQTSGFKTLNEGQRVSFDVIESPKGPSAENVQAL